MEPTTVLPVISLLSLVSVEYGGWALLGFLTGRGQLGGSANSSSGPATPMPVCCWCSRSSTSSTSTGPGTQRGSSGLRDCFCSWGSSLSRAASSSISRGQKNRSSVGTVVTRTGALLLAAALIIL